MIDKEGNMLPDVAVLGINAIPLTGRLEIWKIMEEDISLDREIFLIDTNLRSLCKYDSQGISKQFRLDVNVDHWHFGFLDNTPALYENVSIQSINFSFRLVLFLNDILVRLFIPNLIDCLVYLKTFWRAFGFNFVCGSRGSRGALGSTERPLVVVGFGGLGL